MSTFADYTGAQYDVRMTKGDDFVEDMILEDGDGAAIDLTGYQFASQLRSTYDGPIVATFSTAVVSNTVTRSLTSAVTSGLEGDYVHDFQWIDPSGRVRTLFSGVFEIVPEVTR